MRCVGECRRVVLATVEERDVMAAFECSRGDLPTDEPGAADDEDPHQADASGGYPEDVQW